MLHFPCDGGAPRRTRSTWSPSSTTAPTAARGASGYSREIDITAHSPHRPGAVDVRPGGGAPRTSPPLRPILPAGQRLREPLLFRLEPAPAHLDPVRVAEAAHQRLRGLDEGWPPAQHG